MEGAKIQGDNLGPNRLLRHEQRKARIQKEWQGIKNKKGRKRKPTQGDFDNFFYTIPDSKLLTLLIIVAVILAVIFLIIFRYVTRHVELNDSTNGVVGGYLSIVAVPVGVVLAFIVASAWATFSDAQVKENEEATKLLLLFNVVQELPNTEDIQQEIIKYTSFIITDEFPLMRVGVQSTDGLALILELGNMIYAFNPEGEKQSVLYAEMVEMYEEIISLRIIRMGYAVFGLAPELWWVLLLGVIIVIVVSYFLYIKSLVLQAIMVGFVAAVFASMLFLIVALNYPYRGDFALDELPFEISLAIMRTEEDMAPTN